MRQSNMKSISVIVLALSVFSNNLHAERKMVDKIIARVNGSNILQSDLQKARIGKNGQNYSLDEITREELYLQKARDRKLLPSELEVEKQIVALKIHNELTELTEAEFEEQLRDEGFSLVEYKSQLARMLAVEKLKHAEFSERVVVTSQAVEDYYKGNPEWGQEEFLLKTCDLSENDVDENGEAVKKNDLKWDDLGWIERSKISSDLDFVTKLAKNETAKPIKIETGYRLFKVEDKKEERLKSLDERYVSIERMIQYQKKEKFEKEFEKELKDKATIIHLG